MNAHKRMIISDILSKDNLQFIVPIYQREYKWTPAESDRIVHDILSAGNSGAEHFIGSIVYQLTEFNMSNMRLYLVDGQQRLTTIMLIAKALNLVAATKHDEDDDYDYVFSKTKRIIYIDADDKSRGYTVYPSENDRLVFNAIISAKSIDEVKANPMIPKDNFMFNNFISAYKTINDEITSGSNIKNIIYNGLLNLSVVEIIVEKNENAQAIFESINSLGVKLNNAELIQNYLLMSNDNQEQLYENRWKPMKNNLIGEANMEMFVKQYLYLRLEYQINDDDIYKEFLKYAERFIENGEVNREKMIDDLYNVAEIFEPFICESIRYSDVTNKLMSEFREMDQSTSYPFLMRVFLDHKAHIIDDDTLNNVINLIIVYSVRRTICGVSSATLRKFMLTLYKRIFKVNENYEHYYESVYAFLHTLRTNDAMRSEAEMLEELKTFALYRNTRFATYLLNRIENGRYPKPYTEMVVADKISVEHIMPQQLTDEWINMLGADNAEEIHDKYLNTLGNLSLSSRSKNSIMSNESFEKKKGILKAEKSKFIELNKGIDELDCFGEKQIVEREQRLEKIVKDKFELPKVDTNGIKFEDSIEIICEEEPNPIYQGSDILSYSLLGKETTVSTYTQLIVLVAKQLYDEYPEVIRTLAVEHFNPWSEESVDCIHYSYGDDDKDALVTDNIRVHLGYNAKYCVQFCVAMMKPCGLESDQLSIFLKKDTIKGNSGVAKAMREEKFRQALEELSAEGVVDYDYDTIPNNHKGIRFQIDELTQAIDYHCPNCNWNGVDHPSCYFVEYSYNSHELWVTIRSSHHNKAFCDYLIKNQETLGISVENTDLLYWHIVKYPIDNRKIFETPDIVSEIKAQFISCIEDIKLLAARIALSYVPEEEDDPSGRMPAFEFSSCGIQIGDTIEYGYDSSITARVIDNKHVEYEGETYSLSSLIKKIKGTTSDLAGPRYFKFNGKWLNDIRSNYEE